LQLLSSQSKRQIAQAPEDEIKTQMPMTTKLKILC